MKKNIFLPAMIILLVVAGVTAGAYWYSQDQEISDPAVLDTTDRVGAVAATLSYQQGSVVAQVDGADWTTVETDTILHAGDGVSTGEDSKAIVELENGDVIRLGYNTQVTLTAMAQGGIIVTQESGASYHRVAKDVDREYQVVNDDTTITALGTAFDVVDSEEKVDVGVIESKVKVKTGDDTQEVAEGSQVSVDKSNKGMTVLDIDGETLTNDWYTWNKEEDSKKTDKLGVLSEYAGPTLSVDSPSGDAVVATGQVTVSGTVGSLATALTVNEAAVDIVDGTYTATIALEAGKNIITVVATDAEGHRTVKEVKVVYQTEATATPLTLSGETKTDGVHLTWNATTSATFKYYKLIRSETNDNLTYPGDTVVAALVKGEESFTNTDVSADKTYYFRVCEVMLDDQVFCSNVIHMAGKSVAEPEPEPEAEADEDRVGIFLSGVATADGIKLTWTVEGMEVSKGFKVARSLEANPEYPGDDAKYLEDSSTRSYTWSATDGKTYHFRVCQYTGEGACLVYSNDIAVTASAPNDGAVELIMSAKAESTGVGLWWTDVADNVTGFKYYKVVRSKTNADLRYPDDSHIAAKSADDLSHRDYSAKTGVAYYYRICAVGDSIYCSNVVQVTATHSNSVPSAVSLSGTYAAGTLTLSWSASAESDFKYFKLAWSQTDSTPTYPTDSYIKAISSPEAGQYADTGEDKRDTAVDLSTGTHYYSLCVVDSWDQVACSNTVTLIDGVVQ